jgi:hypothetical protein
MPALIADNALVLILAIAGFWFVARVLAPAGGGGLRAGVGGLFRREKPVMLSGLGKEEIATLLEDTRALVIAAPDLRGLLLAGPFANRAATGATPVTLILLAEAIEPYGDRLWLARWGYPARGHLVLDHDIAGEGGAVCHSLTLRGSPPLRLHIVRIDTLDPPAGLRAALAEGAMTLEDPTGIAEKIRLHWVEQARKTVGAS